MRKRRASDLISALLVFAVMLPGCAGMGKAVPDEELWARFTGEWVNGEYSIRPYPNEKVITSDFNVVEHFGTVADEIVVKPVRYWTDPDKNTYCQFFFETQSYNRPGDDKPGVYYSAGVMRIDESGTVLEFNWMAGVKPEDTKVAEYAFEKLKVIDPALKGIWVGGGTFRAYTIHYRK